MNRPFHIYLTNMLLFLFCWYKITRSQSDVAVWSWGLLAVILFASFLYTLIKPHYFEVKDGQLIINRDFFRTTVINLDDIEKIEIAADPFTYSRIVLKNQSKIRYMDSQVNDKDLKAFVKQFNIPIHDRQ